MSFDYKYSFTLRGICVTFAEGAVLGPDVVKATISPIELTSVKVQVIVTYAIANQDDFVH